MSDLIKLAEEASIANAAEHEWTDTLFLMQFGAVPATFLWVWAKELESAFEEAVEWLDGNVPGHLVTLTVDDLKEAAEEEGIEWQADWPDYEDPDFQTVVEKAEADLTPIGHTTLQHGQYVPSYEWRGDEIGDPEALAIVKERSEEEVEGAEEEEALWATEVRARPSWRMTVSVAEELAAALMDEIKAPFVMARVSTLGGAERPAVIVALSADPKEEWSYGIMENSRYAKLHIDHDGVIEFIAGRVPRFRKARSKSPQDVVDRINKWVRSFPAELV